MRVVLGVGLLACLGGCESSGDDIHHSHTNVLWITVCTLRADHLGAYGYPLEVSPTLDSLAARGVLFERTLTGAPWTRPAIASMVTALDPRSLGFMRPKGDGPSALQPSIDTLAERLQGSGYYTIGITANPLANPSFHFDQGYDFYEGTESGWHRGYEQNKRTADEVVDVLLDQLRGPARDRKFQAHIVLVDTHVPYLAEVARRRVDDFSPSGSFAEYDLQIRYVDTVLAGLLEELESLGRHDTLIVVTSDHGEGLQEGREEDRFHGSLLYNSTLWVPFILYHPALESRARRVPELVQSVDALPTVLELLGIPFDAEEIDGRSLAARILGRDVPPAREIGVVETRVWQAHKSALLSDGWKLIVDWSVEPAAFELYRYEEDRLETRDLSAARPRRLRRMLRRLGDWQAQRDARAPEQPAIAFPSDAEIEALRMLGYVGDE